MNLRERASCILIIGQVHSTFDGVTWWQGSGVGGVDHEYGYFNTLFITSNLSQNHFRDNKLAIFCNL